MDLALAALVEEAKNKLRLELPRASNNNNKVIQFFTQYLKGNGKVRKEDGG